MNLRTVPWFLIVCLMILVACLLGCAEDGDDDDRRDA